ncbi:AAA family ATPase [Thioclava sp. GXIMD4215]|uniref:AAA family ATPase n=1 Tax=Thioclava sp. GXIMD4215 TaxID=3131928 RepID=UPI0032511F47
MQMHVITPDIAHLVGRNRRLETERAAADGPRNGSKKTQDEKTPYDGIYHDADGLLGGLSPLDLPLAITRFRNVKAQNLSTDTISLNMLAGVIRRMRAKEKNALPLLKLGTFGDARTPGGSLRHDANLVAISGIEGDYDDGKVTAQEAAARMKAAGIACLIYTTPSHTPDAPRWRVLAPISRNVAPAKRDALCARVNGALGGILAGESFTLSQSYYFGGVEAEPVVHLVEGRAVDDATDVPSIGKVSSFVAADMFDDILGGEVAPAASVSTTETPPLGYTAAQAADCLRYVPNGDRSYMGWLAVAASLRHESWGRSKAETAQFCRAFVAWSRTSTKHFLKHPNHESADAAAQKLFYSLNRETGVARTMRSIVAEAQEHGWSDVQSDDLESEFEDQPEAPQAPVAKSRLSFLSPADCDAAPSRSYLMKGLLAEQDVACIFGAPGAGKSLLAPFLAYALAQGREAFGMRSKAGGVFYVAAEDPHGMRGRVKALRIAHGDAEGFQLVEGVSDLLAKESPDLMALRNAVKEQKPKLIILDTLAMSFPGLEENSAEAMGRVVAVARALTKWGAAVILIHHDTKAEGATPRGHSLLNGALDVALHVKRDDSGIIRGKLTKNRNGSCDRDIAFRIATEDGGVDEDGDRITLPRCEELDAAQAPEAVKMTPAERATLDVIHNVGGVAEEAELRRVCIEGRKVSASDNPDSRRRVVDRALKGLIQKGSVTFQNGIYRVWCDDVDDFDDLSEPDNPDSVRTNPGLSEMAKRRNPDGLGHTPLGVSGCPDDAGEGVL